MLAALRGRDCLAVLPTGGGKSLCFQVPALLLPGLTLVVSPLISLMQDQVRVLQARGVAAAYLSSTQSAETRTAVLAAVERGSLKLLYVAPERLPHFVPPAGRRISLLAVDEAHCVSEWGHEFRPQYRSIGEQRRRLGNPPAIALTATATADTRADIARVIGLVRPVEVSSSFDRPSLRFFARRMPSEQKRLSHLQALLRKSRGRAIVYAQTRNRTDGVAAVLRRWGFAALPYHAGLPGRARKALLARFLDGRITVIVATSAFGMGIDKADVRLVVHVGVPKRPEAYYQEAGRAGRDGQASECHLLWMRKDLEVLRTPASPDAPPEYREAAARGARTMRRYVEARRCRRRVLLEYLGECFDRCAGCDRCER